MTDFVEVQFPTDISYGAKGGPVFSTDVVTTFSGHEQRNVNWAEAKARYNVASGVKSETQWQALIAFFRARQGRAVGFRYKDWSDYRAVNQNLGIGNGTQTAFQLVKRYNSGGYEVVRTIKKPVNNSFLKMYKNGVLQSSGYSVNYATGAVTFTVAPGSGVAVTADFEFDVPVRFDTDELDLKCKTSDLI